MTSALPAVLDALIAAAAAAPALEGVQVFDGPPVGDLGDQVVILGWSGDDPSTEITDTTVTFDPTVSEQFAIPGQARSYSGDVEMAPRRTAVFALLDAVCGVADALAPVGVNCEAGVTVTSYTPRQIAQMGAEAEVRFTITVTVYR